MSAEATVIKPGHPEDAPEAVNGQNEEATIVDSLGDEEDDSDDYDEDEEADYEVRYCSRPSFDPATHLWFRSGG
jgi:hypothetical protein